MHPLTLLRLVTRLSLALLAVAAPPTLAAGDPYSFEIVIFERPGSGEGETWSNASGRPDRSRAVGDLKSLSGGTKSLGPVAYTLRQKGMIVHEHLRWRQTPGQRDSASWRWLAGPRLEGLVRVTRGRFLHLDTDLRLRASDGSGSYRIKLNRRMRSDELHYIDHPKLGIIIRADRVGAGRPTSDDKADSGEPKPAQPSTTPSPS